jgi:hypothetical protein
MEINATTFPAAKFANIGVLMKVIMPLLTLGAALIFLAMLMYGGFTVLTAGGNPDNIAKAKKIITASGLGLILVISAYLIVKIVGIVFNVPVPL